MKTTTFGGGPGKVQPIRREIKYIVHFLCLPLCPLGCKENERRVVLRHTTTEKAPVPLGPSDYPVFMPFRVLLEAVGILKTRGFYAPTGCSNSSKSLSTSSAVLGKGQWENKPPYRGQPDASRFAGGDSLSFSQKVVY